LNRSEELLALLEIIPFDAAAAKLFDGLRTAPGLCKVGRADFSHPDCLTIFRRLCYKTSEPDKV
jgi:hypothetical protein